jgi:hypothetical protein
MWTCKAHCGNTNCDHIKEAQELGVHKELLWAAQLADDQGEGVSRDEVKAQLKAMRERSEYDLPLPGFNMLTFR